MALANPLLNLVDWAYDGQNKRVYLYIYGEIQFSHNLENYEWIVSKITKHWVIIEPLH